MPLISIASEKLFYIGPIAITNTLLMSWVVVLFLIVISQIVARRMALIPAGLQNVVEFSVEKLMGLMDGVLGDRAKTEKYFGLVATIFIMVLISNWFGIIPGVGSIGFYALSAVGAVAGTGQRVFVPFLRSAASDLNFTLAIAIIAVIMVNVYGIIAHGLKIHASRYFSFKSPIAFFVGILELLSEFSKIISFSFRLFGNIFAGEVLLIIVGFLVPYFVPVPFLGLELFVGFIQALVFATLTLVFISIAVAEHH